MVESLLPKQVVVGSNPIARSKFIRKTSHVSLKGGLVSRRGSRSFFVSAHGVDAIMGDLIHPDDLGSILPNRKRVVLRIHRVLVNLK